MDKYSSFRELQHHEIEGVDYRIRYRSANSGIALLCIHGGDIEPGTSEIADGIAGDDHTFYALEGLKISGNKALHITSTVFDEPLGLEIICHSEILISVHGCAEMRELIYMGGLDRVVRDYIGQKLNEFGFNALIYSNRLFRAVDQKNICNLCGRGMGVQFEVSRGLRSRMFRDLEPSGRQFPTETYHKFVKAVRCALELFRMSEWAAETDGWEIMR